LGFFSLFASLAYLRRVHGHFPANDQSAGHPDVPMGVVTFLQQFFHPFLAAFGG